MLTSSGSWLWIGGLVVLFLERVRPRLLIYVVKKTSSCFDFVGRFSGFIGVGIGTLIATATNILTI